MSMGRDLSKSDLYEGVKTLVELQGDGPGHFWLRQEKLFTLFSVAFQYLLYRSTKTPGSFIIRIEDSRLAEKLAKKSKDPSTRKFLQALLLPRKMKYGKSSFYLDFFHLGSWNLTKDIGPDKLKACLVVKNSSQGPQDPLEDSEENILLKELGPHYYINTLKETCPTTMTISMEDHLDCGLIPVEFPFIKSTEDPSQTISGVTLGKGMSWDKFEE